MNPFAASSSASRARNLGTFVALIPLALAVFMLSAPPLHAESTSSSFVTLSSIAIMPASGGFSFTDQWNSQVFAQAQNSLGELIQNFNASSLTTIVSTNAAVTFATSQALADPTSLLNNTSMAMSTVNIPNQISAAASSQGTADIFNGTFMITGGQGPVNVNFDSKFKFAQSVFTDQYGILATSEIVFALLINGNVVLFYDSPLAVGSNASKTIPLNTQELSNSIMLNYGQDYTFYMELDAESSGQSAPEPSTIALLIGGPGLALTRRWFKWVPHVSRRLF